MPNLYGQSVAQQGLYGKQVLSERNQQQAQELGLPSAHAGGAGSQVEANDPFANFEDYFNANRSWAEGAAKGVGDKVGAEAPEQPHGTFDGSMFRDFNKPKPQDPSAQMPQAGEQRQRPDQAPSRTGQIQQIAQVPNVPQATPSNYLTSLQAQADAAPALTQLSPKSGGSLLSGFGDQDVTAHQYEANKEVRSDGVEPVSDAGVEEKLPGETPVQEAAPPVQAPSGDTAVAPPTTEAVDPAIADAEERLKGAQAGAAADVGPTADELKKLDQLSKVNEMLGAWGTDEGQSLLGPEATAWDAALMQAGGGKALQTSLNESYGGKDIEYAQEIGRNVAQRQVEKGQSQKQADIFEGVLRDGPADAKATEGRRKAVEEARQKVVAGYTAYQDNPDTSSGYPDWSSATVTGIGSQEDFLAALQSGGSIKGRDGDYKAADQIAPFLGESGMSPEQFTEMASRMSPGEWKDFWLLGVIPDGTPGINPERTGVIGGWQSPMIQAVLGYGDDGGMWEAITKMWKESALTIAEGAVGGPGGAVKAGVKAGTYQGPGGSK